MNKTSMLSIYEGIERQLIEQQEKFYKENGRVDYGLMIKLEVIQNKIADILVTEYDKQSESDKSFLSEGLEKYGITI